MTIDEFNNTRWGPRMSAKYQGKVYRIASVDFEEKLLALDGVVLGTDEPSWVRCESIELDGRFEA